MVVPIVGGMRHLPLDHPGTADTRSPLRFLGWLARNQWRTLAAGMLLGTIWMACQAVMPAVIGRAVDEGVATGDTGRLALLAGVLLGIGVLQAVSGIMRHRFAVTNWLTAAYRTIQLVTRQATRLGATLPKRVAKGEVVAIGTSDLSHLGNVMDVTARATGALVSFVIVAVLLLQTSVPLGLVVLLGVPVVVLVVGPLLRPLQRRSMDQRQLMGALSNLATDIVSGLRVLRGVGGEQVFHTRYVRESQHVRAAGVRVARVQSLLEAAQVLLPGLFVVLVVWLAARLAAQGTITIGELVAFYGYAAFLLLPLRTLLEYANVLIRALVSARRVCTVLALEPEVVDPAEPYDEPLVGADLVDVASGLRVRAGEFLALVSDDPESAETVADRLGGFAPGEVRFGGVPLSGLPRAVVRRRIVVSDTASALFSGTLRDVVDVHGAGTDALLSALRTAAADDVLRALPAGLDTAVTERGRSFSGGQRQRLVLARALASTPEVLVLVEPTSAVDAHTEAIVAARLRENRAGRTTVVVTSSPLMLDAAERVAFLRDGRVVAEGTHRALVRDEPAYRAVVTRDEEVAR